MSIPIGDRISFHCLDGFIQDSVKSMVCLPDGQFDGLQPRCQYPGNSAFKLRCLKGCYIWSNFSANERSEGEGKGKEEEASGKEKGKGNWK